MADPKRDDPRDAPKPAPGVEGGGPDRGGRGRAGSIYDPGSAPGDGEGDGDAAQGRNDREGTGVQRTTGANDKPGAGLPPWDESQSG